MSHGESNRRFQWEAATFDPAILELLETDYSESTNDAYGGGGKNCFQGKNKRNLCDPDVFETPMGKKESPLVHFEVTIKVD